MLDIDCLDQLVESDDTLVWFIDLSWFYRFHWFILEDTSACSFVHPKRKTDFMQTVILLTIELQLRVEGSNNYHFLKKTLKKSHVFFKTRFKVFVWWPMLGRFFMIKICHPLKITSDSVLCVVTSWSSQYIKIKIDKNP